MPENLSNRPEENENRSKSPEQKELEENRAEKTSETLKKLSQKERPDRDRELREAEADLARETEEAEKENKAEKMARLVKTQNHELLQKAPYQFLEHPGTGEMVVQFELPSDPSSLDGEMAECLGYYVADSHGRLHPDPRYTDYVGVDYGPVVAEDFNEIV